MHVLGPSHGNIEQAAIDAVVPAFEQRGQPIGPQQQNDAEVQAACAMSQKRLALTREQGDLITQPRSAA
jgi:hypothetical protein